MLTRAAASSATLEAFDDLPPMVLPRLWASDRRAAAQPLPGLRFLERSRQRPEFARKKKRDIRTYRKSRAYLSRCPSLGLDFDYATRRNPLVGYRSDARDGEDAADDRAERRQE